MDRFLKERGDQWDGEDLTVDLRRYTTYYKPLKSTSVPSFIMLHRDRRGREAMEGGPSTLLQEREGGRTDERPCAERGL